jgi:hypothetical protein
VEYFRTSWKSFLFLECQCRVFPWKFLAATSEEKTLILPLGAHGPEESK